MSRITIHNYEAFLLDMAEGTIADNDHTELMLFLSAHPELDVDLDGIAYATLEVDGIHFQDKEQLKKTPLDASRFDELAVKQLEEGLSTIEETELQKLLLAMPALAARLTAYSQTKLQPDYTITFTGKEALKRDAVVKPLYYSLAAAASVVLLVGAFVLFNNQGHTQQGFAAYTNHTKLNPVVSAPTIPQNNVVVVKQPNAITFNTNNVAAYQPKKTAPVVNNDVVIVPIEKQQLVAINTQPAKGIISNVAFDNETAQAIVVPMPYIEIPEEKPSFLQGLWAGAKGLIKKSVNDEEVSARIDTLGERSFNWADLAFFGGKGIQKITGKKNPISASRKGDGSSSEFSIGRYTIVTNRKDVQ